MTSTPTTETTETHCPKCSREYEYSASLGTVCTNSDCGFVPSEDRHHRNSPDLHTRTGNQKQPAGRYLSLAQITWTWARLERTEVPRDIRFDQMWVQLVAKHGLSTANEAADTYDRDLYVGRGWEAAL